MILLHYTGMELPDGSAGTAVQRGSESIRRIILLRGRRHHPAVPEARRAWHAGVSSWHGVTDINSCSIGIEIVNPGHDFGYPEFPAVQIEAVIALCRDITRGAKFRWPRMLAHSDVAPARKNDPGEKFPWVKLVECRRRPLG